MQRVLTLNRRLAGRQRAWSQQVRCQHVKARMCCAVFSKDDVITASKFLGFAHRDQCVTKVSSFQLQFGALLDRHGLSGGRHQIASSLQSLGGDLLADAPGALTPERPSSRYECHCTLNL